MPPNPAKGQKKCRFSTPEWPWLPLRNCHSSQVPLKKEDRLSNCPARDAPTVHRVPESDMLSLPVTSLAVTLCGLLNLIFQVLIGLEGYGTERRQATN